MHRLRLVHSFRAAFEEADPGGDVVAEWGGASEAEWGDDLDAVVADLERRRVEGRGLRSVELDPDDSLGGVLGRAGVDRLLAALGEHASLESLTIKAFLDDEDAPALARALAALPLLRSVNLSLSAFGDTGLELVAAALAGRAAPVDAFVLNDAQWIDEDLEALALLVAAHPLVTLELGSESRDGEDVTTGVLVLCAAIEAAPARMRSLYLTDLVIADAGPLARAVAAVAGTLEELMLHGTLRGAAGAHLVMEAAAGAAGLTMLDVADQGFGERSDAGEDPGSDPSPFALGVARVVRSCRLTWLDVDGTLLSVADETVVLAAVRENGYALGNAFAMSAQLPADAHPARRAIRDPAYLARRGTEADAVAAAVALRSGRAAALALYAAGAPRLGGASKAARFVSGDGDTAQGHRLIRFLF